MDTKVIWKNGLSFTGSSASGFEVRLGSDPAVGGADDGFRPMELIAVGLAGCTGMDVISILQKKKQDVTGFEVHVLTDQAREFPKVFTQAEIHYIVTGHSIDEAALVRAVELSATKYCPAQAMLAKAFPIMLTYEIYEALKDGGSSRVKAGEYRLPSA